MKSVEEVKEEAKKEWYIQGFNGAPNYMMLGEVSGIRACNRMSGYGYTKFLSEYRNDYCDFGYYAKDLENVGREFMRRQRENPAYLSEMIAKYDAEAEKLFSFVEELRKKDLSSLPAGELIGIYQELFKRYYGPLGYGHLLEGLVITSDGVIKAKLLDVLKKARRERELNRIFSVLTQPVEPSFTNLQNLEMLRLAKYLRDNGYAGLFRGSPAEAWEKLPEGPKEMIWRHVEKYYWLRCNYASAVPLGPEDIVKELAGLVTELNLEEQIEAEEKRYAHIRSEKEKLMEELGMQDEELRSYLSMMETVAKWQDDRKIEILVGIANLENVLSEIVRRFGLKQELMRYLIHYEVDEGTLRKMTNEMLEERRDGCVIYSELVEKDGLPDVETTIFTGDDYKALHRAISAARKGTSEDLHGLTASTGKVSGRVRICKSLESIRDFKEGDVLVASMTRPEFVPAMKKAAAIVTDEGGITCHAAIVSRELGIPCIIGTKMATRVLKDGDIVEVNANHGLVRVLEKKEQ